jgi:TolB-like protein
MTREPQLPMSEPRTAAEWFVALDAAAPGDAADRDGAAAAPAPDAPSAHDAALARCAAAVTIARGLADDPELRWAYDEAAAIARGDAAAHRARAGARARRTRLAWTCAGLAAAALVMAAWVLPLRTPSPVTAERSQPASRAAEIVAAAAPIAPVILLPGGTAVDANSVAVLPFAASGDESSAAADIGTRLEKALVADLATVPGIYVRGGAAAAPYALADWSAAEIGVMLGTRGIVSGHIERLPAGVRIHAQLSDAATNRVVWRGDYDAAPEELGAVSVALVDAIAATLVDPALRRSALAPASSARADHSLASVAELAADR